MAHSRYTHATLLLHPIYTQRAFSTHSTRWFDLAVDQPHQGQLHLQPQVHQRELPTDFFQSLLMRTLLPQQLQELRMGLVHLCLPFFVP